MRVLSGIKECLVSPAFWFGLITGPIGVTILEWYVERKGFRYTPYCKDCGSTHIDWEMRKPKESKV